MLKEWKFMLAQEDSLLTVSLSNPPPSPLLHVLLTDFNVEAEQNCQSRALKQRNSQISSSPDFNKLLSRNLLRGGKSFFPPNQNGNVEPSTCLYNNSERGEKRKSFWKSFVFLPLHLPSLPVLRQTPRSNGRKFPIKFPPFVRERK
jgi:hypothetical protein